MTVGIAESEAVSRVVAGYHKPPFSILRWLGFGDCSAPWMDEDEFPETEWLPGRQITDSICLLDWKDRLRVLLSGTIKLSVSTKNHVDGRRAVSRSVMSVLARPPVVL